MSSALKEFWVTFVTGVQIMINHWVWYSHIILNVKIKDLSVMVCNNPFINQMEYPSVSREYLLFFFSVVVALTKTDPIMHLRETKGEKKGKQ